MTSMQCSMVCRQMGRHVHVDYCQAEDASTCSSAEREHINSSMDPHPDRAKDFISHALYWRRKGDSEYNSFVRLSTEANIFSGFKGEYSNPFSAVGIDNDMLS